MEVINKSPCLPKNKINNYFSKIKTNFVYRIWKWKLKKYKGIHKNSNFKRLKVAFDSGYILRCIEKCFPKCEILGLDLFKSLIQFASNNQNNTELIKHSEQVLPFIVNTFNIVYSL